MVAEMDDCTEDTGKYSQPKAKAPWLLTCEKTAEAVTPPNVPTLKEVVFVSPCPHRISMSFAFEVLMDESVKVDGVPETPTEPFVCTPPSMAVVAPVKISGMTMGVFRLAGKPAVKVTPAFEPVAFATKTSMIPAEPLPTQYDVLEKVKTPAESLSVSLDCGQVVVVPCVTTM